MDLIIMAFLVCGLAFGFLDGRRGEWWLGICIAGLTALATWRVSASAGSNGIPPSATPASVLPILMLAGPIVYLVSRFIGARGRAKP